MTDQHAELVHDLEPCGRREETGFRCRRCFGWWPSTPPNDCYDPAPCSNQDCCLQYAHSGPCDTKGNAWIPFDDVPFSQSVARHQWHSRGQYPRTCRKCWAEHSDGSDLCGAVIGQERFVGAGLFKTCQNRRPCPEHIDGTDHASE